MIQVNPCEDRCFSAEDFKNPAWDETKDFSSFLDCLNNGELIYTCEMRQFLTRRNKTATFNNEVHYGILKWGNSYVAVAYKPKVSSDVSAAYAEKVAYDIYEKTIAPLTGHHFIPPTVVRSMPDGRVASCQFFVETQDSEDMWKPAFRERVLNIVSHEIIQEMAIFNAVFNNWDRHPGNYLATWREDRFHLASIDNESIENKGYLPIWGSRSYIPMFFTDDSRAQIDKELRLPNDITLAGFVSLLSEYGFKETRRTTTVFNNLVNREDSNRACFIRNGALLVCFHQGNEAAFPLPKPPYSQILVDTYRYLNKEILDACMQPLINFDPERFKSRVSDILFRRDLFLSAASKM